MATILLPLDKGKIEMNKREHETISVGLNLGLGGILHGVADLVEKLGELAEKGEEISKVEHLGGKEVSGVYGFRVKVGLGEDQIQVEPFGNIARGKEGGPDFREPIVDLFEEPDHLLILAEMPGIGQEDVKAVLEGRDLHVSAEKGQMRYRKVVHIPEGFGGSPKISSNNGIVEIRFEKRAA